MTVLITLTTAGSNTGPFNLYSNIDGYVSAFETGVSKVSLLAGYSSALVPDYTTTIRIMSSGACTNYIDVLLSSTSTTTSTSSTTTTTTSGIPCNSYEITYDGTVSVTYIDCNGVEQVYMDSCGSVICHYYFCARSIVSDPGGDVIFLGSCTTTTTTTTPPLNTCRDYTVYTYTSAQGSYLDCDLNNQIFVIGGSGGYDQVSFCADENSINASGDYTIVDNGPCTTTTTTTVPY